jgi:YEATS domain-containing protein 4
MRLEPDIKSWVYEEQLFNEPYNEFYDILTSPMDRGKGGGKGTRVMKGGMVGSVGERTASIPLTTRPDQPFSRETEKIEIQRLLAASGKVRELQAKLTQELKEKEAEYQALGGQKLLHR